MNVLPPLTIGSSQLTSSTVPEAVAATYNAGTTYALGDRVGLAPVNGSPQTVWESLQNGNTGQTLAEGAWWTKVADVYPAYGSGVTYAANDIVSDLTNHKLYESLVGSNTGNALTDTTKWEYIGPTNLYRPFDYERNAAATQFNDMEYVITPGQRVNSIALIGLIGTAYSVVGDSVAGGGEVFNQSGNLSDRDTVNWTDYFFGSFEFKENIVIFDLPQYSDLVLTISITAGASGSGVASIVVGKALYIGEAQQASFSEALNYSTIDRDEDGNAILTRRRSIPQTNQTVVASSEIVERCRKARRDLNGSPAVWCGLSDDSELYFNTFAILGVYKDWSISAAYKTTFIQNITIEEL